MPKVRQFFGRDVIYPDDLSDEEVDLIHNRDFFATPQDIEEGERPWGAAARRFESTWSSAIGRATGSEDLKDRSKRLNRVADLIEGKPDDLLDEFNRLLAGTAPETASVILGTGAGMVTGGATAPIVASSAARLLSLFSKLGTAQKIGGAVGGTLAGAVPSLGRITQEAEQDNAETGAGDYAIAAASGALNMAGLAGPIAGALRLRTLSRLKRGLGAAAIGSATEGGTEAAQEFIEALGAGKKPEEVSQNRILSALAGGATLGALFGGLGAALSTKAKELPPNATPEQRRQAETESIIEDGKPFIAGLLEDKRPKQLLLTDGRPERSGDFNVNTFTGNTEADTLYADREGVVKTFFNSSQERKDQFNEALAKGKEKRDARATEMLRKVYDQVEEFKKQGQLDEKGYAELRSDIDRIATPILKGERSDLLEAVLADDRTTVKDFLETVIGEEFKGQLEKSPEVTDVTGQDTPAIQAMEDVVNNNWRSFARNLGIKEGQKIPVNKLAKDVGNHFGIGAEKTKEILAKNAAEGNITREGPNVVINKAPSEYKGKMNFTDIPKDAQRDIVREMRRILGKNAKINFTPKPVNASPEAIARSGGGTPIGVTRGDTIDISSGTGLERMTGLHEGFEFIFDHLPKMEKNKLLNPKAQERARNIIRDGGLDVTHDPVEDMARAFSVMMQRNMKPSGHLTSLAKIKRIVNGVQKALLNKDFGVEEVFGKIYAGDFIPDNKEKVNIPPQDKAFAVSLAETDRLLRDQGGMARKWKDGIVATMDYLAGKYPQFRAVYNAGLKHFHTRAKYLESLQELSFAANFPLEAKERLESYVEAMMNNDIRPEKINESYTLNTTVGGERYNAGDKIVISNEDEVSFVERLYKHLDTIAEDLTKSLERMTQTSRHMTAEEARALGKSEELELVKYMASLKGKPYFPRTRWGDVVIKGYKLDEKGKEYLAYVSDVHRGIGNLTKAHRKRTAQSEGEALMERGFSRYQLLDTSVEHEFRDMLGDLPVVEQMIAKLDQYRDITPNVDATNYEKTLLEELKKALVNQTAKAYTQKSHNIPGYLNERNRGQYLIPALTRYTHMMAQRIANQDTIDDFTDAMRKLQGDEFLMKNARNYRNHVFKPGEEGAGIRTFGFRYYLSGVASGITNLFQVPQSTVPFFASTFGLSSSIVETVRAAKDIQPLIWKFEGKKGLGNKATWSRPKSITKDEWDILTKLKETGDIDKVRINEVTGMDDPKVNAFMASIPTHLRKSLEFVMLPFTMAEAHNRMTTALSAIRLAKKQGINKFNPLAKSTNYEGRVRTLEDAARFSIHRTQFMMGKYNRIGLHNTPGLGGLASRTAMQFMDHPIMMLENFRRAAKLMGDLDPEVRSVARKHLTGLALATISTAGLWGLPLLEPTKKLTEYIYGMLSEDDLNIDAWMRDLLGDTLLGPDGADGLLRGMTRPLLGVDMSGRTGLQLADDRWFEGKILPMMGPIGGFLDTLVNRATTHLGEGREDLAFYSILPVFMRHAFMTMEESGIPLLSEAQGVRSTKGRVLIPADELSTMDSMWSVLGFGTAKEANAWELQRGVNKEVSSIAGTKERITEELTRTRIRQLNAGDKGDSASARRHGEEYRETLRELAEYNKMADPRNRIDPKSVLQSVSNRVKQDRQGLINRPRQRLPDRNEDYIMKHLVPLYGGKQ